MDSYVNNTVGQIGSFEYEYFLKVPETGKPDTGSAILGSTFEVKDRDDMIMLLGIDYTVKISDVIENDSQSAIYCSRNNSTELLDMPEDLYNIIMSEEAIDIDEEKLAKTVPSSLWQIR